MVPVFWIDAEDHDWPEVSGCTVLDAEMTPQTITLGDLSGAGHLPIGHLVLDEHITHAVDALHATLPGSDFTSSLIEDARNAYRPGVTMAEAFGRFLESVLGPHGLVVYDASDPAAKPLASSVFARELAHPGKTAELASKAGEALIAGGYHAQVTPHEGAVSLFYLNGGRESIRFAGDRATIGDRHTTACRARG